jgi:predicted amidophosphoribosyltransferase
MDINIVWFVPYARQDRLSQSLVRIIKKHQNLRREIYGLDVQTSEQALNWFGDLSAETLRVMDIPRPILLVPIPNSDCVLNSKAEPRTKLLATSIARRTKQVIVADVLRWNRKLLSAHRGGVRDRYRLADALSLTAELPSGASCILVDDVLTTGGHVIAAASRLNAEGMSCMNALCLARTIRCRHPQTFGVSHEIIRASPAFDFWKIEIKLPY